MISPWQKRFLDSLYRVIKVERSSDDAPKFFGMIEIWWESEEARAKVREEMNSVRTRSGRTVHNDFAERVTESAHYLVLVEERVIFDRTSEVK